MLVDIKAFGGDVLALIDDAAGGGLFEEVQASDKCGFTGPGRADHHNDLPLSNGFIDPLKNLQFTEALAKIFDFKKHIITVHCA